MTSGIPGSKLYPLLRQAVDMRSLVKKGAVATHIGPAQIINKKENNVGLICLSLTKSKK
jgi:hypothetical protein